MLTIFFIKIVRYVRPNGLPALKMNPDAKYKAVLLCFAKRCLTSSQAVFLDLHLIWLFSYVIART